MWRVTIENKDDKTLIRSVVRAFAVLDCFGEDTQRLTLHEICQKLGLPKSTVFRLLNTLMEIGYLHLEEQKYCLSFRVLRLANFIPSTLNMRVIANSELRHLGALTGETVSISVLEGIERIVIDVVESPSLLRSIVRVGEVVGLQTGAVSRVFMAFQDAGLITDIFREGSVPSGLEAELSEVRAQGYACSIGDRVSGASGMAAPIFDINGACNYCISIAGPEARMRARRDELAQHLIASTQRISRLYGNVETF